MDSQSNLDRYNSRRSTVYGTNGIVATSQPLAAETGIDILRSGGNAFDAAVGTAAVLNVVEPMSTGLGGDMFALYRTAENEVGAFRSCGAAPKQGSCDSVQTALADMGENDKQMPERGGLTVTVPGAPKGWETIISEFGHLPLNDILDDAIQYAREGFPVTPVIASMWKNNTDVLTGSPARDTYLIDGKRAPVTGEKFTNQPLAETLSTLAENGSDPFYHGKIAEKIVNTVQSDGGLLEKEDLEDFEPEFIEPVTTRYGDSKIFELPPNNQGLIALEALNIAEELGCHDDKMTSSKRDHLLIEAMKVAFTDGHHYITDPEYQNIPDLSEKSYAAKRASNITSKANERPEVGMINSSAEESDTVLLTVADSSGNVVSFINSIYKEFGSGLVADSTGITLQNRGASFSLDSDHPNHIEPGKRPFHTLIPGLIQFDDEDWAAFGVMGGFMQPQGHLQVLTNILDKNMDIQAALDQPRWRYMSDGTLAVEPRYDPEITSDLARRGHDIGIELPVQFGGGQVARYNEGILSGSTEPRKDGIVTGF